MESCCEQWPLCDTITWHQLFNIIVHISSYRNKTSEERLWINANLSLPLLPLGTSPLIVVPITGHEKKLEEPSGRKGEQNNQFELFLS